MTFILELHGYRGFVFTATAQHVGLTIFFFTLCGMSKTMPEFLAGATTAKAYEMAGAIAETLVQEATAKAMADIRSILEKVKPSVQEEKEVVPDEAS